ncbi:hypothetical protein K443DRAFT_673919 [Laccaria amethystina LaAM-08-1]|jgi:hypothetical protein|uniref:Uncharacterized protein n=1 Tax=Laccaria amethystina LaAM-08-1 TaxID=1095629 RepID=A0A0C9X4G2_9AGAR|nr:hypothetical protein K443DRAFT_673919 [Laccaria amethystina LaAM-08-1]
MSLEQSLWENPTTYMCARPYVPHLFQSPCDQVSALLGDHEYLNTQGEVSRSLNVLTLFFYANTYAMSIPAIVDDV